MRTGTGWLFAKMQVHVSAVVTSGWIAIPNTHVDGDGAYRLSGREHEIDGLTDLRSIDGRGRRIDRERRQNCGGCRQNTIDLVGRSAGRACDVHAQDRVFTFDKGQRIVPARDHAARRSTQRKLRTEELDGLRKLDTVNFQRPHVAPFPLYGGCRLLRCCMQLHLPEQAPDCVKRRLSGSALYAT